MVHLNNARPHNSRKSGTALTGTKAHRIPAPAYSPVLSPSDFFLFGMPKERTSGTSSSSPDALISAINALMASLSKDQLISVYKNWMKRLNWLIKHRGSTTANESNCILLTAMLTEIARYYKLSDCRIEEALRLIPGDDPLKVARLLFHHCHQ
jgi:hypothetical protein